VPTSKWSVFIMTLEKPAGMPDDAFNSGLKDLEGRKAVPYAGPIG
jgi:hypothetical protein